jgi:hypothetical protein
MLLGRILPILAVILYILKSTYLTFHATTPGAA